MPFQPLQIQPANRIDSSFDFYTPLTELGKQWAKNRDEEEAAKMVAGLFAQSQQADAAAAQGVSRPVQPQAAPPPAATRSLTPAQPPLPPDPVPTPRGLTRGLSPQGQEPFGPFTGQQRITAGHEATTLDPAQRIAGGFDTLAQQPQPTPTRSMARGFAPEEPTEAPAQPAPVEPMARSAAAISAIESGSKGGNYQELGPVIRKPSGETDRAYGRYQVMGKNVPEWTEKYFGQRLTPQQFVANPAAQDAVFNGKFGEYTQKYGPTGAAKAWFAGERGMNNPNAKDMLGTSVSSYADKFNRGMGGLPPEITSGTSKPQAPEGLPPTQAAAFDSVVNNLSQPRVAAGTATGISSAQIAALYKNPVTRPIAAAYLQKALNPEKYDFHVDADNVVRYNKATGGVDVMPLSGKPTVVTEGGTAIDRTGKVLYGGGGDTARFGKLSAGERWKDPNNKALGVEPIPGSEKEKIDADVAGRMGLAKKYLSEVGEITQRLQAGELGVENTANHLKGLGGLGAPGELRRKIDAGSDALIRMLTGAGMPATEATDYARRYRLTARDTKDVLLSKTKELSTELISVGQEIGKGRGGFRLENGQLTAGGAPIPREAAGGSPQKLTQEQYKAAPSGTQYLDPNGVLRTKR